MRLVAWALLVLNIACSAWNFAAFVQSRDPLNLLVAGFNGCVAVFLVYILTRRYA